MIEPDISRAPPRPPFLHLLGPALWAGLTLWALWEAGRWLVLPVALILFLQWPLRDFVRAYSRGGGSPNEAKDKFSKLRQFLEAAVARRVFQVVEPQRSQLRQMLRFKFKSKPQSCVSVSMTNRPRDTPG